jgi:hypothetical protein
MLLRRKLVIAWLALVLNALAPVFAYAHINIGASGEIVEYCAAHDAGDTGTHQQQPDTKKGAVAHCPYCPGFSAGAALGQFGRPSPQSVGPTPLVQAALSVPYGRSSVRIAQQRAPPAFS